MKIYTRTGDEGETSIIGGRLLKSEPKVEAYGTVDEANSIIGLAIAHLPEREVQLREDLTLIQHELFDCGSDLSIKEGREEKRGGFKVHADMASALESKIDAFIEEADELECFILPGGSVASSYLHVARTIVRRAERRTVALAQQELINPHVRKYLNRLSDYLFAAARVVNKRLGVTDIQYVRSGKVFKPQTRRKEAE